jgi:hypothetical protein
MDGIMGERVGLCKRECLREKMDGTMDARYLGFAC